MRARTVSLLLTTLSPIVVRAPGTRRECFQEIVNEQAQPNQPIYVEVKWEWLSPDTALSYEDP